MGKEKLLLFFILMGTVFFANATIHFVDIDASGQNNGQNWEDAFNDLKDALSIAEKSDQIWIAEGSYYPSYSGERDSSFKVPGGVALYGGFLGGESSLDERDWENNQTILSGNIGSSYFEDNSFHVVELINIDSTVVFDGIIISDGTTTFDFDCFTGLAPNCNGAGIYIRNDGVTVNPGNVIIRNGAVSQNHSGEEGSAIYVDNYSKGFYLGLFNTTIYSNYSETEAAVAIFSNDSTRIEIDSCLFINNGGWGIGGLLISQLDTFNHRILDLRNSIFEGNGGAHITGACYLSFEKGGFIIDNCLFNYNAAGDSQIGSGAALNISGAQDTNAAQGIISRSKFYQNWSMWTGGAILGDFQNLLIENCQFVENFSDWEGGALWVGGESLKINACTFIDNYSTGGGFSFLLLGKKTEVTNCIFWNTFTSSPWSFIGFGSSTPNDTLYVKNTLFQSDSCEHAILPSIFSNSEVVICENLIFNEDPLFKDPENLDFSLAYCSPVIDRGIVTHSQNHSFPLTDIDGNLRIVNQVPDLGAYENDEFILSDSTTNESCFGLENGGIELSIQGGASPYQLFWNTLDTNEVLNSLSPGVYEVTVTDQNNCSRERAVEILGPDSISIAYHNTPATGPISPNGTFVIDTIFGGMPPYQIDWSNGDTVLSADNLLPGDYLITVSDSNGCEKEIQFTIDFLIITESEAIPDLIKLFPNPTTTQFYVIEDPSLNVEWSTIYVYNAYGALMRSWERRTSRQAFYVGDLPEGIYFYSIKSKGQIIGKGKLLVRR